MKRVHVILSSIVFGGVFSLGAMSSAQQSPTTSTAESGRTIESRSAETIRTDVQPTFTSGFTGLGPPAGVFNQFPHAAEPAPLKSKTIHRTVQETILVPITEEEQKDHRAFQLAIQAIKSAKDDASRRSAEETVQQQLVKQFDDDLKQRTSDLTGVEERITNLQQQLLKRKASKDAIITLRLKTVVNQAEGLGFPNDPASQRDANQFANNYPNPNDFYNQLVQGALVPGFADYGRMFQGGGPPRAMSAPAMTPPQPPSPDTPSGGPAPMPGVNAGLGGGGSFGGMAPHGPTRQKTITKTIRESVMVPMTAEEIEQWNSVRKAVETIKETKDDASKQSAIETIKQFLIRQFDGDMTQREAELVEVEDRLKGLRQQLEKRKASKDQIVALRLQTIVNNSLGLGFPGDDESNQSDHFGLNGIYPAGQFQPTHIPGMGGPAKRVRPAP